eukprot:CAMPEP_0175799398 /NCGR_PEP_ID=MMETSP0097-20121207/86487_1 /TAXON_ID=311494 /ORGANISM="Alexandrium monilatum, Strain CCMP3105" /LENGTH=49 /DNA_ID= /DNA_START= /DNA_END= /DNA_ORIENTATION=
MTSSIAVPRGYYAMEGRRAVPGTGPSARAALPGGGVLQARSEMRDRASL